MLLGSNSLSFDGNGVGISLVAVLDGFAQLVVKVFNLLCCVMPIQVVLVSGSVDFRVEIEPQVATRKLTLPCRCTFRVLMPFEGCRKMRPAPFTNLISNFHERRYLAGIAHSSVGQGEFDDYRSAIDKLVRQGGLA